MSESEKKTGKMKGILTDVTKCIGCERCVEACCEVNKLPTEVAMRQETGDGLSGRRFTSIVPVKAGSRTFTVRKQCLHCLEPTCAAACLVGAFTKTPDGAVQYDASKCIGCRYCMLACPFGIPRYEWDKLLPYIRKCKMDETCRVAGGAPACVTACPTGATIFGNREELLEEAKRRLDKDPQKYYNHRIWGEHDFGGTCVMYIAPVDLGPTLGFPKEAELERRAAAALEEHSIKHMVEPWVYVTPIQFGVVSTSLFGIWLLRRRSLLMNKGPHDRGGALPGEQTAAIDEVCHVDEPHGHDGKEGK